MDTGSVRHRLRPRGATRVLAKGQLRYAVAQADTQQARQPVRQALRRRGDEAGREDRGGGALATRKPATAPGRGREAAGGGCSSVGNTRRNNGHSAVPAGQSRQDGDLPGRIRGLEARRQADAGLRVFGDRRHAGEL